MIVVTTAGTLLLERRPRSETIYVRSQTRAPLESLIEQLELLGTHDNPTALPYSADDIKEQTPRVSVANQLFDTQPYRSATPFSLLVHEQDVALFLSGEVLNFLNYRLFRAQRDGLDEAGRAVLSAVLGTDR